MPITQPDLRLHEELMLLALRDEKGTLESKAGMYQYALGGAVLAELLMAECIKIGQDKKKLVDLRQRKAFGDPVLDDCLALVATARRRRNASNWVARFAGVKRLRHRVAEGLCRRGILKESEDKVLLIFTRKIYPTINPAPEKRVIARLRRAIFTDTASLQPRTAILLALAQGVGMLPIHFDKKKLKQRKRRIKEIVSGELIGGATREAIQAAQAAQAAATAAITAATIASTAGAR